MTEIGEQTCQHWNWSRNNFGPLNEIPFPGFDGLSFANEPSGTLAIRMARKGGMVHTTHANRCTGRTGSHWVRCWASVEGTSWEPNIPKMRKIKRNDRGGKEINWKQFGSKVIGLKQDSCTIPRESVAESLMIGIHCNTHSEKKNDISKNLIFVNFKLKISTDCIANILEMLYENKPVEILDPVQIAKLSD